MIFFLTGILLTQLLYVLGNWRQHRSADYLAYARYIVVALVYILCLLPSGNPADKDRDQWFYDAADILLRPLSFVLIAVYVRFADRFLELANRRPELHRKSSRLQLLIVGFILTELLLSVFSLGGDLTRSTVYLLMSVLIFLFVISVILKVFLDKQVPGPVILRGSMAMLTGWLITILIGTYKGSGSLQSAIFIIYIPYFAGTVAELFFFNLAIARKVVIQEEDTAATQKQLINQLKQNEMLVVEKQSTRNKIARDLHDELGSTLSGVALFSELSLRSINRRQYEDTFIFLRRITRECTYMTDKMNDIVWTSHAENDSIKKILRRLFEYAKPICSARNIRFIEQVEPALEEAIIESSARNHLYLFSKEAINNAIKHSSATEIIYSARFNEGQCLVRIIDNGSGFNTNAQHGGNGIKNMEVRAAEMGLELIIKSLPGQGTCITLQMKADDK